MSDCYIYSKLANGITFTEWNDANGDMVARTPKYSVDIKGGAGVTDPLTRQVPQFAQTIVSSEEFKFLNNNTSFLDFVSSGCMIGSTKPMRDNEIAKKLFGYDGCGSYNEDTLRERAKHQGIKQEFDIKKGSE